MTHEQEEILKDYTDDLSAVQTMSHHDYVNADSKKVSMLLDEYHIIWFHDNPGTMYLVKREE